MKRVPYASLVALIVATGLMPSRPVAAQTFKQAQMADPTSAAQQSLSLAEHGKCREGLQLLRKSATQPADKELRLKAGVAAVRCAISREETTAAVEAIQMLNREFPHNPEVLYITTHAYSDLWTRASLELATTAPDSYQAHELNAETLELQGKWDEAQKEYQAILQKNANVPGIHFRLGRFLLSRPNPPPEVAEAARREFEEELKIDPRNAGAEYVLGELARQEGQWPGAEEHFAKATKLDASLTDAWLGLGISFLGDGKPSQAIPPLETYVKLQPGNPAGHYQLAIAYNRAGRKEDARQEAARQREADERVEQEKQKAGSAPPPGDAGQPASPPS